MGQLVKNDQSKILEKEKKKKKQWGGLNQMYKNLCLACIPNSLHLMIPKRVNLWKAIRVNLDSLGPQTLGKRKWQCCLEEDSITLLSKLFLQWISQIIPNSQIKKTKYTWKGDITWMTTSSDRRQRKQTHKNLKY